MDGCAGRRTRNQVRSSSVSKPGGGEPLLCIARRIFGTAGRAAFGQIQFLQELADPPVAVAAAHRPALLQILHADRAICAGEAQDQQLLPRDSHLDGFALLVGAVVDGVGQRLFDRRHREVPEPIGFGLVGVLDDRFLQVIALDVGNRIAQDRRQRPAKLLLLEIVAAGAVRKPDHVVSESPGSTRAGGR